ncbi:MAG: hypothetical protein QHH29_04755 [bacterium]|jgi:hypothetical protein|nr:hypothetical protein [candidate division WOR-3 bacterium]MDH7519050.1 hypothetical protein [bacterium]
MKQGSVILVTGLVFAGLVMSQPLPVRIYGDSMDERATALVQAVEPDGFCLAGWTKSYGPGSPAFSNVLLLKTDQYGTPVWARISVGLQDDEAYSMVRTHGNCYALCGFTRSYGIGAPQANIFIAKFSSNGNMLWGRVYGGGAEDIPYSIIETADRGFALCGLTHSFGPAPYPNMFLLRLDSLGRVIWFRVYWMIPDHIEDESYSIVQTRDNGFAICGRAKAARPNQFDALLMKTDGSGNPQWLWIVPGDSIDEAHSVAVDFSDDILVAGWTKAFVVQPVDPANLFVAKFSPAGNFIWSFSYGWINGAEKVVDDRSLVPTFDSGCVVCGPTTSVGPGIPNANFLLMKLGFNGNIVWARSHPSSHDPGLNDDVPLPMVRLNWGGYAIAGYSNSYQNLLNRENFILSTFDQNGMRPICVETQEPEFMTVPWIQWEVADSFYRLEEDSIPFTAVDVRYDSVCYDTSGVGLKQGDLPVPTLTAELKIVGRWLMLKLGQTMPVDIQIYTADGRWIGELTRSQFAPGLYRLALPDKGSAGVYMVCAMLGKQRWIGKVVRY